MRTKNAKRLWPVPVTLGVMALAALLAFGLMATNGAQPAAAQANPDCTVANTGIVANNSPDTATIASALEDCSTSKTSAVVALEGALGLDDEDDLIVWVYAKGGSIADATTLTNVWDHTDTGNSTDTPKATRFSGVRLEIPEGVGGGIGGGGDKRQTVDITVTPASGNDDVELYVYYQAASPIPEANFDHDDTDTDASPDVLQIDQPTGGTSGSLTVTFLGSPAVGEDGPDLNNDVDDDEFQQCYLVDDTSRMKVVLEEASCPGTHTEDEDIEDLAEIRSKLIAVSGTGGGAINTPQVDGTTKTHKPAGETSVTVYAVIQDANGNHLEGAEVNFSATIEPPSVVDTLDFDTDRDVDAKTVGSGEGEIDIAGDAAGVEDGYAVAVREINGLPSNSPYKLTITVTVEGVPLGEIVIVREGAADKVLAAIFSAECFAAGGTVQAPDYEAATFNMNDDDCEEIGMSGRFGHGQMVFVKSHIEDALDNIIGDGTDLDSELADEDDDLLGDGDPTLIEDPVDPDATGGDPARAWLYMIHEDATLGDHMITVSTDTKGVDAEGDERDIDDVMLTVNVAGPPAMFSIEGPMSIDLSGSGTFTVTATDAMDQEPYFKDPASRMVSVFIQGLTPGNLRGLSSTGMLELDAETAMGSFSIYAPPGTAHGSTVRIFVSEDDMEASHTVMFGGNRAPMAEGSIADQMVDAGSYVMVDVSGAFTDADMDTLTYTAESDMMDYATASVDDMGMVTITGVAARKWPLLPSPLWTTAA